jgi:hypothetical protein
MDQARVWLDERTDQRPKGVHATDLINPLRAYWRETLPRDATDREVGLFVLGQQLHELLTKMAGLTIPEPRWDDECQVWYSLDAELPDGTPVEFKTSRSLWQPRGPEDLGSYIRQLVVYMGLTRKTTGLLIVWYLMLRDTDGKTTPRPLCWTLSVSPEDIPVIRATIAESAAELRRALERRDPSALPLCEEWMCESCQWWHDCRPRGRYDVVNT